MERRGRLDQSEAETGGVELVLSRAASHLPGGAAGAAKSPNSANEMAGGKYTRSNYRNKFQINPRKSVRFLLIALPRRLLSYIDLFILYGMTSELV